MVSAMIVAIDGPAGAGKSTVARAAAEALGFAYLDSGALYRCVALASLEDPTRSAAEHAAALEASLGERILLGGRDVTHAIRSPTVSAQASVVAADPAVREALVASQRDLLASGDWVAEGRDIGTVVAPAAELKIFLEASEAERAARRARELGADPGEVARELRTRDARDRGRDHSPLAVATDAVVLDTDGLSAGEVVAKVVALAGEAQAASRR
jgi:cytidylate kinase